MTELDFYKWVQEWQPEYRWQHREGQKEQDVIFWVNKYSFDEFIDLLPDNLFSESGIECTLINKSIAIWASDILEPLDIKIENIFPQ
jgi:hypothetical protein